MGHEFGPPAFEMFHGALPVIDVGGPCGLINNKSLVQLDMDMVGFWDANR